MTFGPKYSTHKMEAFPQRDTHKSGKFSKVIECLEQNTQKYIGYKRQSSTKQMSRVDFFLLLIS